MATTTVENNSQQDYDIITIIIAIISIIITELGSCFIPSQKKSQEHLVTSHSPKKNVTSSSKRKSTTTAKTEQCHATVVSTATSVESSVATGNLSTATSNSKVGMMSQPTRKSKSGPSTQSRSRRTTRKSNQTTLTAGLGFSV